MHRYVDRGGKARAGLRWGSGFPGVRRVCREPRVPGVRTSKGKTRTERSNEPRAETGRGQRPRRTRERTAASRVPPRRCPDTDLIEGVGKHLDCDASPCPLEKAAGSGLSRRPISNDSPVADPPPDAQVRRLAAIRPVPRRRDRSRPTPHEAVSRYQRRGGTVRI
jgi:hypothetical protein